MISRDSIAEAYSRIAEHIRHTPVVSVDDANFNGASVWLKLEHLQYTGSFKPRGVFNSLLGTDLPPGGVVAVSGGNHGAAVGYAATRLGIASRIFVPSFVDEVKVDRMRGYGARVDICETMPDAFRSADDYCREEGAKFIHPWDQVETINGQGTIGLEIEEHVPDLDTLLVAVGGGGLIGGIAAWYGGRIKIVSVESTGTPTLATALEQGQPCRIVPSGIAASALGAPEIGALGFEIARRLVDRAIVVPDEAITDAQARLWRSMRLVAEPGGVTALAAVTSGQYVPAPGEKIGVLICGGNAEPDWFLKG